MSLRSFFVWCVCILLSIVTVSQAVLWSPSPPDETIVQTCVGDDVTLPWNFTLEQGETLEDIKWYYADDKSSQLIALWEGSFVVLPTFSGRVHHVGNAGLVLSHVVESDGGNYSVQVSADRGTAGVLTTSDRTIILRVATDPQPLMDVNNLTVTQSRTAVYNNLTDTWHVQLTCGTFTDLGQPPVDVVWKTPSGSALPSTSYEDGQFHLLLTNPPPGGDYTCTVPASCSHGDDPRLKQATLTVDEVKARLTLLEAHQGSNQGSELLELRAEVQREKAELQRQKTEITDLKQTNSELTNQLGNLTEYVHNLENQLNVYHETASRRVSFHARFSSGQHEVTSPRGPVILDSVITNEGAAYHKSTGSFVVPVSGTYALFVAAGTTTSNTEAMVFLMVDDRYMCYTKSTDGDASQSSSCQAVVRLGKGQLVWLWSNGYSHFNPDLSSFSGVLVRADE